MECRPTVFDVQRTAFLSVSRASLACKARGMASRHTFQNLALTHDAWKRTAGRDYRFTVSEMRPREVAGIVTPVLERQITNARYMIACWLCRMKVLSCIND